MVLCKKYSKDEIIYEMNDVKSSEAMIPTVMRAILAKE